MDPRTVKNVLNMTLMILVFIVLIAVIAVTITNTIYYKKLWDDNGSSSVTEETAKVMFFLNLFLGIVTGIIFFVFIYKWYKLYNIAKEEIASLPVPQPTQIPRSVIKPKNKPLSPVFEDENETMMEDADICASILGRGYDTNAGTNEDLDLLISSMN